MNKTVNTITKGETLLVAVKGVRNGKIQLEFAEQIDNPFAKKQNSLVSMLNKSDDRFSSRARRSWITGEKSDIEELLGFEVGTLAEGQTKELNVLNPEIGGERLRVQIMETITPDTYQSENIETTAKKAGADGDFILHEGQHIFSNTQVVTGNPGHVFLEPDSSEDNVVVVSTADIAV